MSTYITFQCSVCRRTKDILKDNVHVIPNQCTITKGCEGRLFKIGEKPFLETVAPVTGLTDWYARGKKPSVTEVQNVDSTVTLSTSSTGSITLALQQTRALTLARPSVKLKLIQRRVEDVGYQQYLFKPTIATPTVSGRDVTGKNMRFDALAINEGRVFVRVDGVSRFVGTSANEIQLTPNIITFNTPLAAGAVVDVLVYAEKNTIERILTFNANLTTAISVNSGSWENVSYVKTYGASGILDAESWWLYTARSVSGIGSSSRMKLEGVYDAANTALFTGSQLAKVRFFLASSPYENVDRYLNFVVEASKLHETFALSSVMTDKIELFADAHSQVELYPPLQLYMSSNPLISSFTKNDTITTNTNIPTDTSSVKKSGTKIIGPV